MMISHPEKTCLDSAVEYLRRGEPLTISERRAVLEFIDRHSCPHSAPRTLPPYLRLVSAEETAASSSSVKDDAG